MGLMDKIRQAEEHGREKARSAYGFARDLQEDMQRRIRQKMRVYPRPGAASERAAEENGASDQAAVPPTEPNASGAAPGNDVSHHGTVSPSEISQATPGGITAVADEFEDVRNLEAEPEQPIVSIRGKDVRSHPAVSRKNKKPESQTAAKEKSRRDVA